MVPAVSVHSGNGQFYFNIFDVFCQPYKYEKSSVILLQKCFCCIKIFIDIELKGRCAFLTETEKRDKKRQEDLERIKNFRLMDDDFFVNT